MTYHPRAAVMPAFIILCLLLGGASAAGFAANMVLQLAAIPIIAWALVSTRPAPLSRAARQLLILLLLAIVLIGIQLIPLPPGIWTALPGRGEAVSGYQLLGVSLPWLPISLAPHQTIESALWLLPAIAVLLGIIRLGAYKPELIAGAILLVSIAAIALGAVQRAGNEAAYFYQITNYGMATGFFANANHMATLLMCAMPFLAALYLIARNKSRSMQRASGLLVMLAVVLGVLVVGIAINGSLAGYGLSVAVLGASGLMLLSRRRRIPLWWLAPIAAISIAGVILIFTAPLGNDVTQAQNASISRATFYANTVRAIVDFMPFGSGIGSFTSIYPMYEDQGTVIATFANHAHSDVLELVLETGVAGALLIAVFLLWWVRRVFSIWRSEELDQFARAATIASAAILGHSLVDYPLRTAAISAVFAACCALMAEPRPWVRVKETGRRAGARHLDADQA